jgi:arabinose-5-phosphate isomerase
MTPRLDQARRVIHLEIAELQRLHHNLGREFEQALELMLSALARQGKIIICGVGKSGNIGQKLAATLNSTGAPAVNLSVGDALHGDLGLLAANDLCLLMSYSGETAELLNLIPHLKRLGLPVIAITGEPNSTLARHADCVLNVRVEQEACPLNLAPTSSTTVMMVLGDALAMVLLEARGFQSEDFARLHPGGSIGKSLLTRVCDVMRQGESLAKVDETCRVGEALRAMTQARCGAAVVVDANGRLSGIFTHGDFVRAFQRVAQIADEPVANYMTRQPLSIGQNRLAAEVLAVLQRSRVDDVVVVDEQQCPVGLVDTQDLSRMRLL